MLGKQAGERRDWMQEARTPTTPFERMKALQRRFDRRGVVPLRQVTNRVVRVQCLLATILLILTGANIAAVSAIALSSAPIVLGVTSIAGVVVAVVVAATAVFELPE